MIDKYRGWLRDYFQSEFHYDTATYLTLSKVRDFINGEQLMNKQQTFIREYDLLAKVEDIRDLLP